MRTGKIIIFGWAESKHIRRWAPGLQLRGYEVQVVSLGGEPLDGVETHIIPSGRLAPILTAGRAAEIVRRFQPDLVHVHYASTFGYWGLRSPVRPLVVSVWGSDIVGFPKSWLTRLYLKRVLSSADCITATSNFLQDRVASFLSGAGAKTEVIPFGVDLPDEVRAIPESPVRLCFLKAHKSVSGPGVLLNALAVAAKEIPDIRLTLAGDGPMTGHLKDMSDRLGLSDRVDFPGMISRKEVYRLLADSTIMVMPSLEEAFGVAALEASACGRPVVASNVGGTSEVVVDGQTGLMVPPGDVPALAEAIVKLARDRKACEQMGQAGREFVKEKYLWDRSLDLMDALYDRMINGKA
ncbi:MAG: glycosyltransferase family 4 protein [bacterium]|nr:glycosyltransferase family 4 protein [bacterium]